MSNPYNGGSTVAAEIADYVISRYTMFIEYIACVNEYTDLYVEDWNVICWLTLATAYGTRSS